MRNSAALCLFIVSLYACTGIEKTVTTDQSDYTRFVDPFIGTAQHGHVFLGANVPFGAVQLGPVNITHGWDWCSGYNYADSTIYGFAHTHLSGTGIGDLGDIVIMPVTGEVTLKKGIAGDQESGYYSLFSHDEEIARPGYYSVYLKRYGVKAELTTTERVGFHQYQFPAGEVAKTIIDLEYGIGWDAPVETMLQQVNDSTLAGYRYSKGWAVDQRIYFTAIFSKPVKHFALYDSTSSINRNQAKGKRIKAVLTFGDIKDEVLKIKVGISPVSTENAAGNIAAEVPGWDFDAVRQSAHEAWNNELAKVRVESNDTARMRTFYTALYHTLIAPSIFNDANGEYRGADKKVYKEEGFTNLTTFSLWDTYRAAHPLFTILQSDRVNDMINSMLKIYEQQGKLPIWHLVGNETHTMPGYSGVQVVADAWLKGFKGFSDSLVWEALKTTAMQDERGLYYIKKYGYIPADSLVESVALAMEYSIADWCIAQVAKRMGKEEDYKFFADRAKNYAKYYDASVGFMRGKLSDTEWRTPFSPFISRHMNDDFCEGNAWQYTWLVPHDVEGLIKLLGGEQRFLQKLDSLFTTEGDMGKEASADITGLIGQYAHGNEPSHHITYMYAFAGQPWKTAEKVRYILDSLYTDKPDGLCGNEDVGQMSAWYLFSAMGFYPVNPSNGLYVFGSPVMDKTELNLDNGNRFIIRASNNSKRNKYIQSVTLNGKKYTKNYILHSDIMAGGELVFEMGENPNFTWGTDMRDRPYSEIR